MIPFILRFICLSFVSKALGKLAYFIGALVVCVLLIGAPILGMLTNPLAPFWLSGQRTITVGGGPLDGITLPPITVPIPIGPVAGGVSDVQRYLLALGAGFTPAEAIIMTAISIAENGSGNPTALSAPNFDNSRDLGLLQINSGWWQRFGGQSALTNPVTNFIAGRYIYGVQGYCAWSTFESSCGIGHNSAYRAFMVRAQTASQLGGN